MKCKPLSFKFTNILPFKKINIIERSCKHIGKHREKMNCEKTREVAKRHVDDSLFQN